MRALSLLTLFAQRLNIVKSVILTSLSMAGLMLASPVTAGNLYARNANAPIDFTLSFSNASPILRDAEKELSTQLETISLSIFSTHEPHFQLGFISGQSYLSIDNDKATAGLRLTGYHAGIALRGYYWTRPKLKLQATYLYQEVKNPQEIPSLMISSHEFIASIEAKINISSRIGIILGGSYHDFNSRRRSTSNIRETTQLQLVSKIQTYITLELLTAPSGHINIVFHQNAYEGISVNFARHFRY